MPVWGIDNRQCIVRVLGNRAEYRPPDSSCNPYLTHAVMLPAVRDGIEYEIDPGMQWTADAAPQPSDSAFESLPKTLGEALEALAADDVTAGAIPGDLYDTFVGIREVERNRHCGAITDWQMDTYLNYLP